MRLAGTRGRLPGDDMLAMLALSLPSATEKELFVFILRSISVRAAASQLCLHWLQPAREEIRISLGGLYKSFRQRSEGTSLVVSP